MRYIGASIGYAVYFSVLDHRLAELLPKNIATAAIEVGLPINQTAGFVGALLGFLINGSRRLSFVDSGSGGSGCKNLVPGEFQVGLSRQHRVWWDCCIMLSASGKCAEIYCQSIGSCYLLKKSNIIADGQIQSLPF